ncbi:MAG: NAD(P)/FAD-dependent oxidoreductase [Bacteroidota bacterium]
MEFKKYDWRVNLDKNRLKNDNEYDVIIVGSGIGGLSCGALLAVKGYKVLILEQAKNIGGYCAGFTRNGFVFNVGVEDVSSLWIDNGTLGYLLKMTGLKKENLFIKNESRQYIANGKSIEMSATSGNIITILSNMFPKEKENIKRFFTDAKNGYEQIFSNNDGYGIPLPVELLIKLFGIKKIIAFRKEKPDFFKWVNKNFTQKLKEYFKNEDLIGFITSLSHYIDTPPEKTPGETAIIACLSYFIYGGGYLPINGGKNFTDGLKKVIEKNNGEVLVNHKVDKILTKDGVVRGVTVNDISFSSPIVVSNANAVTTFFNLVGEDKFDKKFIKFIKSLKFSTSAFVAYIGLDIDLKKYPAIIGTKDEKFGLVISSNVDPSRSQNGKACVTIFEKSKYSDFPDRGTIEYEEKKKECLNKLLDKVEKIIPSFREHIIVQDTATPKTFERYTSMPQGALYSFDHSTGTKRPKFKTPIKGLYLASASSGYGGGIESVVITGILCCHDINNWER